MFHPSKGSTFSDSFVRNCDSNLLLFSIELKSSGHNTNEASDEMRRISPSEGINGTRKLQDEINVLTKRNCGKLYEMYHKRSIFIYSVTS